MKNETIGRIIGSFVGAALIIAAMAAFGPRSIPAQGPDGRSPAGVHNVARYENGNAN
jgi:hypothetical protein